MMSSFGEADGMIIPLGDWAVTALPRSCDFPSRGGLVAAGFFQRRVPRCHFTHRILTASAPVK